MCGILGVFGINGPVPGQVRETLAKGSERMAHRGPDDLGVHESGDGRAVLHHRRLSIIDLTERGRQPISNASGDKWIIFNGEIYNYQEIKKDLAAKGYAFKTGTDTEVILLGYEAYGADVLHRLRGMFAFAIYDSTRKTLFLARDRIGIKPLYFYQNNGLFYFSSSLHALVKAAEIRPELDRERVYEYLFLGFVTAPGTVIKGIQKFPPAHYAVVKDGDGRVTPSQYWEVDQETAIIFPQDETAAVDLLEKYISDAVRSRLVADVPVSVFLSGGLDSGLVATLANKFYHDRLHTFTLGFKDDGAYNELHEAREVARHLDTIHHEIVIGKEEVRAFCDRFVHFQEEPNSNPIQLMVFFLSKLVRDNGIKVTLAGDGGDELFFGYNEWARYLGIYEKYYRRLPVPPPVLGRTAASVLGRLLPARPKYDMILRALRGEHLFYASQGFTGNILDRILAPDLAAMSSCGRGAIRHFDENFKKLNLHEKTYLNWMRYVTLKTHLVEDYLSRGDNMGMANGIEIRVPLLDHKLVGLAFRMPGGMLLSGQDKKHLMKKVAERHMPREFIYRKKKGFSGPINLWLKHILPEKSLVIEEFNGKQGIFAPSFVNSFRDSIPEKGMNWAAFWGVYSLAEWFGKLSGTA